MAPGVARKVLARPKGYPKAPDGTPEDVAEEFDRLARTFAPGYHGDGDRHSLLALARVNLEIEIAVSDGHVERIEELTLTLARLRRTLCMQPTNTQSRREVGNKAEHAAETSEPSAAVVTNPPPGSWRDRQPLH